MISDRCFQGALAAISSSAPETFDNRKLTNPHFQPVRKTHTIRLTMQKPPMQMIKPTPSAISTQAEPARTALSAAIAERNVAKARHHHAEQPEQLGRELLSAAERLLVAFGDVAVSIVQHRAEQFNGAATGSPSLDLSLPNDLVARRTMRDKACQHVTAARAAHVSLVVDLDRAEGAVQQAGHKVVSAAIEVLVAEPLEKPLHHYAESSRPIELPADIVELLQTVATLDVRQFPDGRNLVAAHAAERWNRWFAALRTNAEAEAMFEREGPAVGTEPHFGAVPRPFSSGGTENRAS